MDPDRQGSISDQSVKHGAARLWRRWLYLAFPRQQGVSDSSYLLGYIGSGNRASPKVYLGKIITRVICRLTHMSLRWSMSQDELSS